ncbi:Carbohydrate Sulfotransferase 7 [Manis pentadactyla]|nr:Carbohydrate Sulfotransferase 7 [Manis pentadactyla]
MGHPGGGPPRLAVWRVRRLCGHGGSGPAPAGYFVSPPPLPYIFFLKGVLDEFCHGYLRNLA